MELQSTCLKWRSTWNTLILLLFLALLLPREVWPKTRPYQPVHFRLGGMRIDETLRHFKQSFPAAACGTVTGVPVPLNRHTLDDPDGSGYLTCCVDDPNSLTKFSEFKVVSVDEQCPVLIGFWREKLVSIVFTVEASSIEKVLPGFEKTYGPPHRRMTYGPSLFRGNRLDDTDQRDTPPLGLMSWWYGDEHLELSIAVLNSANGHAQERRLVQVDMGVIWPVRSIDFF